MLENKRTRKGIHKGIKPERDQGQTLSSRSKVRIQVIKVRTVRTLKGYMGWGRADTG